jgi:predicted lipoprotein with Yx(FWY)xxD motif
MTLRRTSITGRLGRVGALVAIAGASALAGTATAGAASSATITVAHNKTWGTILETGSGRAVYAFSKDTKTHSACTGTCAKAWPPVLVSSSSKPVGKGVSHLGTIKRSGGQVQVTYEGIPLYTFIGDTHAGQVTGNTTDNFGKWWSVNPTHPATAPAAASSSSSSSASSSGSSSASTPASTPATSTVNGY